MDATAIIVRRGEGRHPVDVHVGARLRQRRTQLGLSLKALGQAVGVAPQQIQQYECCRSRISAGRLHHLAEVLGVPITFFFEGLPPDNEAPERKTVDLASRPRSSLR